MLDHFDVRDRFEDDSFPHYASNSHHTLDPNLDVFALIRVYIESPNPSTIGTFIASLSALLASLSAKMLENPATTELSEKAGSTENLKVDETAVQVLSGDKLLNEDGKILACSCAA
jgi:hypothetical protein